MAFFQAQNLWVEEAADGVARIVLDAPSKTNHIDPTVLEELNRALTQIEMERRFRLCLLSSKKATSFCHGTSAQAYSELQTPDAWSAYCALGRCVCEHLSGLRVPTVALIAGACLGSGLELALACDWRVAADQPACQIGFAELEWGLIPCFGGVGRLLDICGLDRGLRLMLGDRKLSAREALRLGLIDEIVAADQPPDCVERPRKRTPADRPRRTLRQRLLESTPWGRRLILRAAERVLRRRVADDMPAPWELLAAVRCHVQQGAGAAMEHIRAAVGRLCASTACRNLLRLQLMHEERHNADAALARPKRIGILGATPLALHLAAQAALKGCHVVLREQDELMLGMASLQLVKMVVPAGVTPGSTAAEQFESNLNRIRPTVSWKGFDDLELVLDATHGSLESEQHLARELEKHVSADAVIACVRPWRALAGWQIELQRPDRALGLHFPSPVGRAPLVEVLINSTSDRAIAAVRGFATMVRKLAVVAQEQRGGLIQRILGAGFSETLHLLGEGQLPERIDQAMHRFGMMYGPLEQLDQLGLDEFVMTAERLAAVVGEKLAENRIVRHMIGQRWLGVKTGIGFYRHAGATATPNRGLGRWLRRSFAAKLTPMSRAEQKKLMIQRLALRMVNEAYRCLDEGVVRTADDLDLALMLAGWAPHRGGPCRFSEQYGLANVENELEELTQQHGARYAPSPLLRRLANP
jgi:3-hydroxyacyl-CoA dehydrogenase / enoyl-CoA hydratase / 3-hydroxybutyryl-CoA epimerase